MSIVGFFWFSDSFVPTTKIVRQPNNYWVQLYDKPKTFTTLHHILQISPTDFFNISYKYLACS